MIMNSCEINSWYADKNGVQKMKKKIESDYTLDELREMMINSHLENDEKKSKVYTPRVKKAR